MAKKTRFIFITSLIFIGVIICFYRVTAQEVTLHIRGEVSSDNGVTWHNYKNHENSGNESVIAKPGDTIKLRLKAWNSGGLAATNVKGIFTISNADYVKSYNGDTDADGNGREYYGDYFTGSAGSAMVDALMPNSSEAECTEGANQNCELVILDVKLKDSFPEGETIITMEGEITAYTEGGIGMRRIINTVFAQEPPIEVEVSGIDSSIKIIVQGGEANPAPKTTLEALPKTGTDNSPSQSLIIGTICLALFLFVGFLSLRVIQTKIHKRN